MKGDNRKQHKEQTEVKCIKNKVRTKAQLVNTTQQEANLTVVSVKIAESSLGLGLISHQGKIFVETIDQTVSVQVGDVLKAIGDKMIELFVMDVRYLAAIL